MGKCAFHYSAYLGMLLQGQRAPCQEHCVLTPGYELIVFLVPFSPLPKKDLIKIGAKFHASFKIIFLLKYVSHNRRCETQQYYVCCISCVHLRKTPCL